MKFKDTRYGDLTGQVYEGDIDCSDGELTSLEGAPKEIKGDFYCSYNQLTSLKGAPHSNSFISDFSKEEVKEYMMNEYPQYFI